MTRLQITERDRLLAAGLFAFIVAFLLFGSSGYHPLGYLLIVGVFAAGAFVFSISPLLRGSSVQQCFALLFMTPVVFFAVALLRHLGVLSS
jgi:hypothetical protein